MVEELDKTPKKCKPFLGQKKLMPIICLNCHHSLLREAIYSHLEKKCVGEKVYREISKRKTLEQHYITDGRAINIL